MAKTSHHVSGSKASCETEIVLSHSAFTWTIKNFRFSCPQNVSRTFDSPVFNSGVNKEYSWQLKLREYNTDSYSKSVSSARTATRGNELKMLIIPSRNIKFAEVNCTFLNKSEEKLHFFSRQIRRPDSLNRRDKWVLTEQLPQSLLECLNNDFVKINFEATVSHAQVYTFIQATEIDYEKTPAKFNKYLSSLFDNDRFSNFVVKVQGRKFPVHKAILAANSPFFEAMFEHDFQEKQSGLHEITDFEADVVYGLLNYMYSHKTEFTSFDYVTKLYEIAHRYLVDDLKELCKAYLVSQLEAKCAMDLLNLAEKHSETALREEVLSFIQEHPEINCETAEKDTLYDKMCTFIENGKEDTAEILDKSKAWLMEKIAFVQFPSVL